MRSHRLVDTEHTARPWRIHQIAPDFKIEDVWTYRTPGAGRDDFPLMLTALRATLTRKWERVWLNREGHPAPGADAHEGVPMISWAGRLIVFFGAAHTLGALTALGAARHAGAWFSRELWREDLADMSPAMSAYWLSINSFGPPLILVGLTVLWLNRRGIMPPPFIAWALAGWIAVDAVLGGPGVGQNLILLAAAALLVTASRSAKRRDHPSMGMC